MPLPKRTDHICHKCLEKIDCYRVRWTVTYNSPRLKCWVCGSTEDTIDVVHTRVKPKRETNGPT